MIESDNLAYTTNHYATSKATRAPLQHTSGMQDIQVPHSESVIKNQDKEATKESEAPVHTNIVKNSTPMEGPHKLCAWCYKPDHRHTHESFKCKIFVLGLFLKHGTLVEQYPLCHICLNGKHNGHVCNGRQRNCNRCTQIHHKVHGCGPVPLSTMLNNDAIPTFDDDPTSALTVGHPHSQSDFGPTVAMAQTWKLSKATPE